MNHDAALRATRDFGREAESMFFLYRDAIAGLRAYREQYASVSPETYIEYQSEGRAIAPSTVGELLARCAPDGPHARRLANATVVTLAELWEHRWRAAIADALAIPIHDVLIPELGDLRHLRNAIVHPTSGALADLARCEVMCWFPPGQPVELLSQHVEEIIGQVRCGVERFVLARFGGAT